MCQWTLLNNVTPTVVHQAKQRRQNNNNFNRDRAAMQVCSSILESSSPKETSDVIVIGSGIGGLASAALLASYGKKVEFSGGCTPHMGPCIYQD